MMPTTLACPPLGPVMLPYKIQTQLTTSNFSELVELSIWLSSPTEQNHFWDVCHHSCIHGGADQPPLLEEYNISE